MYIRAYLISLLCSCGPKKLLAVAKSGWSGRQMGNCCQEGLLPSPLNTTAPTAPEAGSAQTRAGDCMEAGPGELETVVSVNGAVILFSGSRTLIFAGEDFGEPSFL